MKWEIFLGKGLFLFPWDDKYTSVDESKIQENLEWKDQNALTVLFNAFTYISTYSEVAVLYHLMHLLSLTLSSLLFSSSCNLQTPSILDLLWPFLPFMSVFKTQHGAAFSSANFFSLTKQQKHSIFSIVRIKSRQKIQSNSLPFVLLIVAYSCIQTHNQDSDFSTSNGLVPLVILWPHLSFFIFWGLFLHCIHGTVKKHEVTMFFYGYIGLDSLLLNCVFAEWSKGVSNWHR